MLTLEILDRKIKTAEELLSVVKTMKSLAAVNIRQYERAVAALDEYRKVVEAGWQAIFQNAGNPGAGKKQLKSAVVIIIGSDQGMAGRFNEIIVAAGLENAGRLQQQGFDVQFWTAGEKPAAALKEAGFSPKEHYPAPSNTYKANQTVQKIIEKLEFRQTHHPVSSVFLCHHVPAGAGSFHPSFYPVLPLEPRHKLGSRDAPPWPGNSLPMIGLPHPEMFRHLFRQHLFISFFRALIHSLAGENAARLAAMQAAEKNITEMASDLQKSFREQRQTNITSEILDIISGFEALDGR